MSHRHNRTRTPTYVSWVNMVQRCTNQNVPCFLRYGGRGISVCERWRTFAAFLSDMGEKPTGFEIDRIDNDGNYEPGNCRWVSKTENIRNRPYTRRLSFRGETRTLAEWSDATGISYEAIRQRLIAGWSVYDALTVPQRHSRRGPPRLVEYEGRKLSVAGWSRELGISATTIAMRLSRGWEVRRALSSPEARHGR